ncbi:MAG: hypothetical protein WC455_29825 [Dehalococcoidia bacterium]
MYVYIQSEKAGSDKDGSWGDLFTVGFYDLAGKWQPESDHANPEDAAKRVAYLNGRK